MAADSTTKALVSKVSFTTKIVWLCDCMIAIVARIFVGLSYVVKL